MIGFKRHQLPTLTVTTAGVLIVLMLSSNAAFAAGNGYAPGAGAPPSAAVGGFTNVVTTRTFPSSGGIIRGSANGATGTVVIPGGSLPKGGQVVITTGTPRSINLGANYSLVSAFSVVILNPKTGAKLAGPFHPAIRITIGDRSITHNDIVVNVTGPGQVSTISGAHILKGQAIVSFTRDSNLAVVHRR
jgi:hypothetical protein